MNLARDVSWNNAVEPLSARQRAREGYSFLFFRPSSGGKGAVMEVVYRRCCGIDVHKDFITACVLVNDPGKQREVRKKEFRTYWSDLQKLKLWLYASKVEQVAMESTGVYWKPVWNVLEGSLSAAFG